MFINKILSCREFKERKVQKEFKVSFYKMFKPRKYYINFSFFKKGPVGQSGKDGKPGDRGPPGER